MSKEAMQKEDKGKAESKTLCTALQVMTLKHRILNHDHKRLAKEHNALEE